jgi:hypothetical protein
MAFDIYVGPLTRYYRRDWENVAQQWAKANGVKYKQITPGDTSDPITSTKEINELVVAWVEMLNRNLSKHLSEPLYWKDAAELPYFTNRPGWDGYTALLLWTAYSEFPERVPPKHVPKSWHDDEAFQAATGENYKTAKKQILLPALWLPQQFEFVFQGPSLTSQQSNIGSSPALLKQLLSLRNSNTFATEEIARSTPVETVEDKQSLEDVARTAIDLFIHMARESVEHHLPMILDF